MIIELLKQGKIKEVYKLLASRRKEGVENNKKEFNNDRTIRNTQVGSRKPKSNGDSVAKIPIPFQKKIVKDAAAFMFGSPIKLIAPEDTEASKLVLDLWKKTRMDATLLKFCKAVKSETEAAIVLFTKGEGKEVKIKSRLLTSDKGILYPYLDPFGDMKVFGWEFKSIENGKDAKNIFLFTEDEIHQYKEIGGKWIFVEKKQNFFGKIPIVYLSQDTPEWEDVKELIDRFEMSFSKFCDTNDYFASPMFKASGAVNNTPSKDETGRIINLDIVETDNGNIIQGDLDYLTWEHAPESTKLEFETTKDLIYGLSATPNLTLEAVKGIGQIANTGMKLMFLAPLLKAKESEGDYRTAIERLINIMKAGITKALQQGSSEMEDLEFDIQFTSVLPENMQELISMLMDATGGESIMSKRTAVAINPLVEDTEQELQTIKDEQADKNMLNLGESVV